MPMNRTYFNLTTVSLVSFCLIIATYSASADGDDLSLKLRGLFQKHCVRCHGQDGQLEAEIDLLDLKSDKEFIDDPELLEQVRMALEDREMPPEDEPQPSDTERKSMIADLKQLFKQSLKNQSFKPIPIRRMNRFQYNNAVVDLLELDRDLFQLNERLMRRRSDYFRPASGKMPDQVRVSSRPLSKDIDNQRPEGFKGVAAFPQDKRAEHGYDNRADHLTLSPLLMESFLKLSETVVESPDLNERECRIWDRFFLSPTAARQTTGLKRLEAEIETSLRIVRGQQGPVSPQDMSPFNGKWSNDSQLFWRCQKPNQELTLTFEVRAPEAHLRLGLTQARDYGQFEIHLDGNKLPKVQDLYHPEVRPISREFQSHRLKQGKHKLVFKAVGKNQKSTGHFFGLDYVDLIGPAQLPSQEEKQTRSDEEVLKDRLRWFLRRAFRKPAPEKVLDRFTRFAKSQLDSGASYEETMRTVAGAVIAMPDFLYLYEQQPPAEKQSADQVTTTRVPVTDFELATRLSQFFWSSIPDDTLLDLAEKGKLSEPAVLSQQIDRMMNDQKSSRFCDNFPPQWLQLERLITSIPDKKLFPYFYYNGYRTSMHMMSEPLLLFETVFVEDRSILELVDSPFTWQSNMLKSNYDGKSQGGREVQVQLFRRRPVTDPRRGGVITTAAVLTMTSTPLRTQPITRGAWVNAVIFNDPPEPPPADVPPLPELDPKELQKLTIRERLAAHRQRKDCAGCHREIDPLGFALENFGPTGVWRDQYSNGRKVEAGGTLFNQDFKTFVEFKSLLLKEKRRFIRGFVGHLLSYALGRELGPADSPVLDQLTERAMTGQDSMRSVLKSIALSDSFRHKR